MEEAGGINFILCNIRQEEFCHTLVQLLEVLPTEIYHF